MRVLAVLLLLTQIGATDRPMRLGAVEVLEEIDVQQMQAIAGSGQSPWLVIARSGQSLGLWSADVFLPPSSSTVRLRRGVLLTVSTSVAVPPETSYADALTRPRTWSIHPPGRPGAYAQVAQPGRPFDDLADERDLSLPFAMDGNFTDEELVALVDVVRSGAAPGLSTELARLYQQWPVARLSRVSDEAALVVQRQDNRASVVMRLTREDGGRWRIVALTPGLVP